MYWKELRRHRAETEFSDLWTYGSVRSFIFIKHHLLLGWTKLWYISAVMSWTDFFFNYCLQHHSLFCNFQPLFFWIFILLLQLQFFQKKRKTLSKILPVWYNIATAHIISEFYKNDLGSLNHSDNKQSFLL